MDINKPKIKNVSLKNVDWGSPEFDKLILEAREQEQKRKEYERTIKAIKTIHGD